MPTEPLLQGFLAIAICGLAGAILARLIPAGRIPTRRGRRLANAAALAVLLIIGLSESQHLHAVANPNWVPVGQDWIEYLSYLTEGSVPGSLNAIGGFRYYLYGWLAGGLVAVFGVPPYVAGMQIALVSIGLMPAAVFLLVRQLAPLPIALTGGLFVVHLAPLLELLGMPTDYGLAALLQTLTLAAGLAAIRRPRPLTFLGFGCALAALMGATPKALSVALIALPIGLVALPRGARRRALSALGLLGPVALMWAVYAWVDPQRLSLEAALFLVEKDSAAHARVTLTPAIYGLPPDTPLSAIGHWRLGDPEALWRLPETLRILAMSPEHLPPLSRRLSRYSEEIGQVVGLRGLHWAALSGLAALAVRARGARWMLGAAFVGAVVGMSFVGGTRLFAYRTRYFLPLLVLLPALTLAGAAAPLRALTPRFRRDWSLPWWPVPALVAVTLFSPSNQAERLADLSDRAGVLARHEVNALLRLRDELREGDVVVDLTTQGAAAALFLDKAAVQFPIYPRVVVPAIPVDPLVREQRRFLVLNCAPKKQGSEPWWPEVEAWLDESPRFERVSRCVYQDFAATERLEIPHPEWRPPN